MQTRVKGPVAAMFFASVFAGGGAAVGGTGENMGVTQMEIAQLPKFCWDQMGSPVGKGPAFKIPASCGVGMNHYCMGLVHLIRARREVDRSKRFSLLGMAANDVRYTLEWMKNSPNCPIRGHVEGTKAEIEKLESAVQMRR